MTHRNGIGKQGARIAIFKAYLEPQEAIAATQYVGPTNYFSLIWTSETEACLHVHDEFTPGGHLIACTGLAAPERIVGLRYEDCAIFLDLSDSISDPNEVTRSVELDVPELCLHATDLTLNVETNELCVVMSDDTRHCVDLTGILPVYTVMEDPAQAGRFCFYDGETQVICWWEGGFSVLNPDGTVTITNPDGTEVIIPAPLEPDDIAIRHNMDQTVCLVVNEEDVGCWQQGDIVGEDAVVGVHYAIKPDGSRVTWLGTDHVTTASLNAIEESVTITNPNGQTITFPYGAGTAVSVSQETGVTTITVDGEPYEIKQTQVSNGTGTLANQNTYAVGHKGTWPDETIRTMWGTRQGDLVELNFWNPGSGAWDSVAVEAPENLVILNNPVIYIRPQGGTANPPIQEQSDLTVANAFNSFAAVRSFMTRTLTIGTVTLDCSGLFVMASIGNVGPAQFKNAQNITIRGPAGNPDGAKFLFGGTGSDAPSIAGVATGGTVTLRDVQFDAINSDVTDYVAAMTILNGAELVLEGRVIIGGAYNHERPGSASGHIFRNIDGGSIRLENNMTLQFQATANAAYLNAFVIGPGSRLIIGGDVKIVHGGSPIKFIGGFIQTQGQGALIARPNSAFPAPVAVTGATKHIAPASITMENLGVGQFTGAYGNRAAVLARDWGIVVASGGAQAVMQVDPVGSVNGVVG